MTATSFGAGSLVGVPVQRVEDPALLRGEGTFIDNLDVPDVLHLAFVRSPMAHAELGNWPCAANAMRLSQLTEAANTEHFDMVRYANLRRQIEGKAPYTEACKADEP